MAEPHRIPVGHRRSASWRFGALPYLEYTIAHDHRPISPGKEGAGHGPGGWTWVNAARRKSEDHAVGFATLRILICVRMPEMMESRKDRSEMQGE